MENSLTVTKAARSTYPIRTVQRITGWGLESYVPTKLTRNARKRMEYAKYFTFKGIINGVEQEVKMDEAKRCGHLIRKYCYMKNVPTATDREAYLVSLKKDEELTEEEVVRVLPKAEDMCSGLDLFFAPKQAIDMLEKAVEWIQYREVNEDIDKATIQHCWYVHMLEVEGDEQDGVVSRKMEAAFPLVSWAVEVMMYYPDCSVRMWIVRWQEMYEEVESGEEM